MRLKEDSTSWRARGVVRRDFRHSHDGPEVDKHSQRKRKGKGGKRIDHKHVWVERPYNPYYWYAVDLKRDPPPSRHFVFECSIPGCRAHKYVLNTRYGYEWHKWRKRQGR